MPVTNYYTVNGEIIGEHTIGQGRLDYLSDALGSVVATVDQTLTVQSTARYKPFGADLSTTGTQAAFGWAGRFGCKRSARPHADIYIRRRTFSSIEARWGVVDPLWPWEQAYIYAASCPTTLTDPSGLNWDDCPDPNPVASAWSDLKSMMAGVCKDPTKKNAIQACWKKCGEHDFEKETDCFCNHSTGASGYGVSFSCYSGAHCSGTLGGGLGGSCMGTVRGSWHQNCRVSICLENCWPGIDFEQALFHEMMQCCGADHDKSKRGGVQANPDCLEDCLRPIVGWPDRAHGWLGWPREYESGGDATACNVGNRYGVNA